MRSQSVSRSISRQITSLALLALLGLFTLACGTTEDPEADTAPTSDTVVVTTGVIQGTVSLREFSTGTEVVRPLSGATVTATRDAAQLASTTTDADGKYSFELSPGTVSLLASFAGTEPGTAVNLTLAAGDALTQDLELQEGMIARKPNLYLYPTQPTQVDVGLKLAGSFEVIESIPEYAGGWHVNVTPDGVIDGQHTFLYYEAQIPRISPRGEGWSVPASEVARFFNATMNAYGFSASETRDFVDYWKDHLPAAASYSVYPITDAKTLDSLAGLQINPTPDHLYRVWFVVVPNSTKSKAPTASPTIIPMLREGFTAIEWGVVLGE